MGSFFKSLGKLGNWFGNFAKALWENPVTQGIFYTGKLVLGAPIGLYSLVLASAAVAIAWSGKMIDTLIVPLSPFNYLLDSKKRIVSDEWWKSALDSSLDWFKASYKLALFPIADPLKKAGGLLSSWSASTGMGNQSESGNTASKDFKKTLESLSENPDLTNLSKVTGKHEVKNTLSSVTNRRDGEEFSNGVPFSRSEGKDSAAEVREPARTH